PLLAAFLDDPFDPSPYAPVSRLFWNELYVDVERAPELQRSPPARELIGSPGYRRLIGRARAGRLVDHRLVYSLKRRALEELASVWDGTPVPDDLLVDYSEFRARRERGPSPGARARYHV